MVADMEPQSVATAGDLHLYEQVAETIASSIQNGTLRPGDRIPSVRRLSARQKVSMSTVLQAYMLLEDRGLIEARPQSGYYVKLRLLDLPPEPARTKPSASACTVSVADLVVDVHRALADPGIIPFGAACPSPELLPGQRLNRTLASVLRRFGASGHGYDQAEGRVELRQQIARRSLDWGCTIAPDDLVTTCGGTEAINICLRAVTKPGDTIAVESPTYYGALQIIEGLQLRTVEIATDPREGICLDALESALKRHTIRALFVMPNFQNPLGSLMPDRKKRALLELVTTRDIPVIEDDIYGDLYFGRERPRPLKAFDRKGNVLLCSSFSKTLSPGYRVGFTAPGRYFREVVRQKLISTITTPTLPQMAIAEILRNGGYDHYLRKIRKAYQAQVQRAVHAVARYFPEGTKVTRPAGGFILWLELPRHVDAFDLYRRAIDERISIAPGQMFSPKQQFRNCIRISCGHPWSDALEHAMQRLGRLAG